MEITRDKLAEMVNRAIRIWGDEVSDRVRTDSDFAASLQAKWVEQIASAMRDTSPAVQDQLSEDDLGELLVAAVIDAITDLKGEPKES
jgi:hypothetical protein